MKTIVSVAVFSALANAILAQGAVPIINTPPSLVECQPAAITFSMGTAPYFLSVLPAGQVAAVPLEYLPEQMTAGTYTWNVDLAAGSNITLAIRDNTGALNYASPLVVQPGTSTACLNVTAGAAASSAGATAAVGAATTAAGASSPTSAAPVTSGTLVTTSPATVTAASGTPTGINPTNGTSSGYNFTCSQGLLTYAISTSELPSVSLAQAVSFFRNWTDAAPGILNTSSGRGVGAERTYTIPSLGYSLSETLRQNTTNQTTGSLNQQWNLSSATAIQSLTLYSALEDLTVYTNATSGMTAVQFFALACLNDQSVGLSALASFLEEAVSFWAAQLSGTGNATTPALLAARRHIKLY